MKIAIPVDINKDTSSISQFFARSKWFAIWDTEDKSMSFMDNQYSADKWQVGENVTWMLTKNNIEHFASHEFGLKLQNEASKRAIQLILLPQNVKQLKDLVQLMNNSN